jgi:hypothetical protein
MGEIIQWLMERPMWQQYLMEFVTLMWLVSWSVYARNRRTPK